MIKNNPMTLQETKDNLIGKKLTVIETSLNDVSIRESIINTIEYDNSMRKYSLRAFSDNGHNSETIYLDMSELEHLTNTRLQRKQNDRTIIYNVI